MKLKSCACGRENTYKNCCGAIHLGKKKALTSEDLMRSRYTAFTMSDGEYLMKSHHSKTRPIKEKKEIVNWSKSVIWVRLEVLNTVNGYENDAEGNVEFKAFFLENGEMQVIHENSFFIKENENWVYVGVTE
jgi:SEC-C motif-containing protein